MKQRKRVMVGLFKKKKPEQEPADGDLSFFTVSKAREFRILAREVFGELGYEVQIYSDHALDAAGRGYGFWNVAASCHSLPESQWRDTIRLHLQKVLASFEAPDPFDGVTPGEVAQRVHSRLYDESTIPNPEAYPHTEFVPGVVEMLALDLPDTVAVFNREHAGRHGGWEALRSQGIANLQGVDNQHVETVPVQGGGSFTALLGDSVYTASKALLLPGLAEQITGQAPRPHLGWLMSVPNRHQVVWHLINDATLVMVLEGMVRFTAMGYSDAPGPVSPHVYWSNGAGYEQLTSVSEDGKLSIRVGPEFQAVLEAVMSSD
ncbi:hypothetical protein ABIE37_000067 [Arthrobacter bambusae]|uniref:Uncharacterized protein n=1 Tax=Arthrobacter bambusae TaxID=1338426 RepID=A0ABV2P0M6_9MICC